MSYSAKWQAVRAARAARRAADPQVQARAASHAAANANHSHVSSERAP